MKTSDVEQALKGYVLPADIAEDIKQSLVVAMLEGKELTSALIRQTIQEGWKQSPRNNARARGDCTSCGKRKASPGVLLCAVSVMNAQKLRGLGTERRNEKAGQ